MLKKEKEARKYLRNGKITDAIDKFNEAGHELRHAGESEKAIELLEEGVRIAKEHRKLFEGSLCERSLSEIHAELGNREQCLLHTAAFRKMSIESGSRSQEQISYHVEAWCLQQLYFNGAAENTDIKRAIELTKKSRELVESSKRFFKEGEPGGPPHIRKAQLFTLEAQLQNQLGNNTKALQLLSKTDSILKANDKSIRFEMLRTKCSIAPVKERVDIALLMDDEAPEDKKAQTLCELSHQYVLANSIERGYKALAQAFIFHEKQLTASELEDTTKRLCILYRLVKYSRILRNPHREPKISLCELHEAIGDLYDKYFQTLMTKEKKEYKQFIRSNILKSYEKMLELKRNHEDALRAYQGMALVYMDLDDFVKAKSCFENRLDLLNETNASQEKILDAKVSIFSCACKLNFSNLEKSFEELKDQIVRFDTKRELFEIWANYWTDKRNEEKAKEWRSVVDSIPDVLVKNEDDETDVLFWRLTEEDILEKCREENELLKLDNLTEHQKKKTNDKGETLLHLAAMKSDNEAVVEKLCKLGCDVNARDNGGWTPLLEAVGHDQLANAHVLIRYGADVNARSSQSLILDDSQSSSDNQNYGLTPLMDACTNGFIDIAKLLIDNKAKVDLKDSKKWTAYHHLKHFIENGDANEITIKFSEYLKNLTESTLVDIPPCHLRTHKEPSMLDEFSSNEIEDDSIFGRSASRKRRNSNNIEKFESASKRKQRSGENIGFRHSPSPTDIARANKKRPSQPTVASSTQPKRFYRQNSSLSPHTNRNSLSPRHSISPTTTIRSAPSVIEKDDDLQIIQVRRSNGRKESSPLSRTTQPVVVQRSLPPISRPQICQNESEIVVKCCFEFVSKNISEDLRPLKLPMKRTLSIAEVKSKVMSENPSIAQFIIKDVWDKEDKEKAELGDKMLLSHISEPNQREIAIVFQLSEPPAHVIYENSSAKIPNQYLS
uniref:ANK_REP_REGION domain-containing protein n=2 Tax=Caenorhabditis tropicalis TaxID=1561998 RepID=A0A1I7UXV5_9PELO